VRAWLLAVAMLAVVPASAGAAGLSAPAIGLPLGPHWTIQSTPNQITPDYLNGVSCASATACMAVGEYFTTYPSAGGTLAESWDGTSWTIPSTPNPTGASDSVLEAVSCTSANACTAVGYANQAGTGVTLAERWDGTSWTIQSTPNPDGATRSGLSGVSCTSPSACTAVGGYTNQAGTGVTLAERWDGTSWTIQPTPNPTSVSAAGLNAVSCSSASACTAVGGYDTTGVTDVTLAERWDGTSWTIQTTPNSAGNGNLLNGVSCASATACTAVGQVTSGLITSTLAERWNGIAWTIQPTPNPAGAKDFSVFQGVSCASASACTAVGWYSDTQGRDFTEAQRWGGGVWAIQATPNPPLSRYSRLFGVSCTAVTVCTTVGFYYPGGSDATLAERYS
jgi:hypothetical protein